MYPNRYFTIAQWAGDPDDNPLGRSRYQYGEASRAEAVMDFTAAATFNAAPPFDFLRIYDAIAAWTFTFRPDVAPGPAIVVGRTVQVNILGLTAAQVATAFNDAMGLVSVIDNLGSMTARLQVVSRIHTTPNIRVTLTQVQPGITGFLDITGMTVVGFLALGFFAPRGGVLAGRTKATGWIFPVAGASLVDTETFTVIGPDLLIPNNTFTRTFEFNSGGGITAGRTEVPFTGGDTAITVANSIATAMNSRAAAPVGAGPNFGVKATVVLFSGVPLVFLQAQVGGSIGGSLFNPNLLQETVANVGFRAFGMSGGQDGAIMAPLRWGLSRGAVPISFGFDQETGEG